MRHVKRYQERRFANRLQAGVSTWFRSTATVNWGIYSFTDFEVIRLDLTPIKGYSKPYPCFAGSILDRISAVMGRPVRDSDLDSMSVFDGYFIYVIKSHRRAAWSKRQCRLLKGELFSYMVRHERSQQ